MATSKEERPLRDRIRSLRRLPAARATKSILRSLRQFGPFTVRLVTSNARALPDVIIVGAQKAGTTQLFVSMARHPQCFGSVKKEVQYFSKMHDKSLAWYRAHFPLSRTVLRANGISLEASPSYLPSPAALERMHAAIPDAKMIVLLRDPVARAFSHYQHYKTRQRESREFAVAVDQILGARSDSIADHWLHHPNPTPLDDYVSRGYYALQLQALYRYYDRSQVLVVDSRALFADTDATTQQVFDFVGLDRFPAAPRKISNRGHYKEKIDPRVAAELRNHYRDHDERLRQLLGRRMSWMDSQVAPLRATG